MTFRWAVMSRLCDLKKMVRGGKLKNFFSFNLLYKLFVQEFVHF